jgi:hypothetical protein
MICSKMADCNFCNSWSYLSSCGGFTKNTVGMIFTLAEVDKGGLTKDNAF